MMKKITFYLVVSFLFVNVISFAQGTITGTINDSDLGGPLSGATIVEDGTDNGAIADFDGNFSLPLNPGTYTINVSFISYKTQKFPNTTITAGKVSIIDATLASAAEELSTVEIVAEIRRNNDGRKTSTGGYVSRHYPHKCRRQ